MPSGKIWRQRDRGSYLWFPQQHEKDTPLRADPSGETHRPCAKPGSDVRHGHSGLQLQELHEPWHFYFRRLLLSVGKAGLLGGARRAEEQDQGDREKGYQGRRFHRLGAPIVADTSPKVD